MKPINEFRTNQTRLRKNQCMNTSWKKPLKMKHKERKQSTKRNGAESKGLTCLIEVLKEVKGNGTEATSNEILAGNHSALVNKLQLQEPDESQEDL